MRRIPAALTALLLLGAGLPTRPALAVDPDVQLWTVMKWEHRWSERWSSAMKGELRVADDITTFSEFQAEPSVRYHLDDRLSLGLTYQFTEKAPGEGDEHDVMQEATFTHAMGPVALSHTGKVVERVISDVPGVVPQLRYVLGATYPLDARFYLAASEEVRVNLRNARTGPVAGFEQNRVSGGIGVHLDEMVRTEIGYLWRYERARNGAARSDNVILLQIVLSDGWRR
jgi:Protein of unknown function (DUF2490)